MINSRIDAAAAESSDLDQSALSYWDTRDFKSGQSAFDEGERDEVFRYSFRLCSRQNEFFDAPNMTRDTECNRRGHLRAIERLRVALEALNCGVSSR